MDFKTAYKEERSKTQSIFLKIAFYGWMNFFKRFIIRCTRIYIQAINDKIYNEILSLKFSRENLMKIPNGIYKESYLRMTKPARVETHFAYVGRLIKSKNLRFLIRTFAKYLSIYPSDKLILFGQGSEEKFLTKFINENNLANNIILWGFEKDKRKIYSNIDVLIHPSFGEGIPLNILEANLTKTFVIASNVSGNRELIENKISGLLFDPFNESDLLNQILYFKEHQRLIPTILKIAKNRVASNNDSDLIVKKIHRFLKSKLAESADRHEKSIENVINNLYIKNEYLTKNPSLHEADCQWKISKIIPLIDKVIRYLNKDEINLLDVGGGSGSVLREISIYIEDKYGLKVNKFAIDLSLEILEIQKKNNPDLKKVLNEDICNTSLGNKEIDITLMIDVLEHIANPKISLEELKRISNYVIFKVPLEDNLLYNALNFLKRGKIRQFSTTNLGHLNFFRCKHLKQDIELNMGVILDLYFTNVFKFLLKSSYYKNEMSLFEKILNLISLVMYRISPKLSSLLSNDFTMILGKCY